MVGKDQILSSRHCISTIVAVVIVVVVVVVVAVVVVIVVVVVVIVVVVIVVNVIDFSQERVTRHIYLDHQPRLWH